MMAYLDHNATSPLREAARLAAEGALAVGGNASSVHARALCAMKLVGLNVAADPLFNASYVGVRGGLVVVSADDPDAAADWLTRQPADKATRDLSVRLVDRLSATCEFEFELNRLQFPR